MKFLVDAQLPKALSDFLNYRGHDSLHTTDLPKQNATTDNEILAIANDQKRIVVTKDSDFLESFLLFSQPEKLIVVRTGNIPNKELIQIFSNNLSLLERMLVQSNLIEVTNSEIAEHS